MIAAGEIDQAEYDEMRGAVEQEVFAAIEWAQAEPYPELEDADDYVYTAG